MNEEPIMSDKDAKQILAFEASIGIVKAYCKRCFADIEREKNQENCRGELEQLADTGLPIFDTTGQELLDACKTCEYKTPYVADTLEEE